MATVLEDANGFLGGNSLLLVLATTFEYFQNIMSEQQHVHEGNVLRLRGIPWSATEQEIAEFFKGTSVFFRFGKFFRKFGGKK